MFHKESYGPSFSAWIYGPGMKLTAINSSRKIQGYVTYSTDQENEICKIFIISPINGEENFNSNKLLNSAGCTV